jgi:hypothetical protein
MAIIRTACADADEQYGEGMSVNAAASDEYNMVQ